MGAVVVRLARGAAAEPFRGLAWLVRCATRGGFELAARLNAIADWIEGPVEGG